MKHTHTVIIAAPIERVFELIDNPEASKQWLDGLEDTSYTEGEPTTPALGKTFKQRIREGARVVEYDGEVIERDAPRHLALRIGDGNFTMHVAYTLTQSDDMTELQYVAEGEVHTWYGQVSEALYSWFTKRVVDKHLAKLKEIAEKTGTNPVRS